MSKVNIAVIGASGALGRAFVNILCRRDGASIQAFSRTPSTFDAAAVNTYPIDFSDEASVREAAEIAARDAPLQLVLVASGLLHEGDIMPEKSLRDLAPEKFNKLFLVNTIGPALVAKYFLPKLAPGETAIFAALSARVGSIADNRLGGWYAYRASKAALNMIIKTASLELARRHKQAIVVGLHPGTVASKLSLPFQKNVPAHRLFDAGTAAEKLLAVVDTLTPADSGKIFAWDGDQIPY